MFYPYDTECPFLHGNIDTLYGVESQPIEQLPKVCTCGKSLTYAKVVKFVTFPKVMRIADENKLL